MTMYQLTTPAQHPVITLVDSAGNPADLSGYIPSGTYVPTAEAGTTIGRGAVIAGAPVVTYSTKWGINAGVPYYDAAGAAPGQEAILVATHFVNQGGVPFFSSTPVLALIPIASA